MVSLFHRNRPDDGLQAGTRSMMGPRRRRGRAKAEVGRWLERLEDRTLLATVRLGAGDVDNLTPPAEPTSDVLVPNQNRDTSTDPYTVTTTSDSGTGSLRQAILNADAAASGPITIRFQIPTSDPNFVDDDSGLPGGDSDPDVFVIQPLSALPALHNANASIVIDGTTQTAFTGETNPFGPEVVLDGTSAGAVNGLTITSNDNVIIGLDIRDFVGAGSGVLISGGASNRVSGCYIGVDATGTSVAANGGGVIVNSAGQYNIVGTDGDGRNDAAEGNLISGNFTNVLFSGPGTDYNVAAGNLVGTDRTGEVALANPSDDVGMNQGASFNRIGTNSDGVSDDLERNVIVGAHFGAITVYNDDTDGNLIAGNYVGVDITGTVAMGSGFGIGFGYSYGGIGAAGTQIVGNVISGNGTGIVSDTATHGTRIAGNLIGTNAAGTAALGNGTGIAIYGFDNVVGGATAAARNVVSGNNGSGILISGATGTGNFVAGNFIGTTQDGTAALGNVSAGVIIASGARDNVIGTNGDGIGDAAEANLISGNALHGVEIYDSQQNLVAGNDIGTDATGMVALANAGNGVQLDTGASNNTIGGVTADERNVISGNGSNGIWINGTDPDDNVIQGNYIGLNAAGTAAIGNLATGVLIDAGSGNEVGGNVPGARNVISGNGANGVAIRFAGTTQDVVQGNFIGTDAAGSAALANRSRGVFISGGAHHNVIGTDGDGANDGDEGNVISGNGLVGVFITDSGTTDNVVAGNFIGTNAAGTAALGNGGAAGVRITGGAQRNRIGTNGDGSSDDLERNIISGNTGNGIQIDGANTRQNVVAGNSIGVNRDGTASLGNGGSGVVINSGAQSNIIGTNGDGSGDGAEGNVISGNASFGIWIDGAQTQNTVIAGNFIGTDANGTAALANGTHGIDISNGASGTRIGTNADGVSDQAERNVISGNAFSGISLDLATTGVVVAGN
ncbi:MAG TPA: hypothetical protein VFF52_13090, partial [Isosphaeraceae bacterium]|nr:hypothetical protein [Isosphaeraceae bacterium]